MKTRGRRHSEHQGCRSHRRNFRSLTLRQPYSGGAEQSPQNIAAGRTGLPPRIAIDTTQCIACKKCERACPTGAITVTETARVDNGACAECGACIKACPNKAISFQ